MSAVAEAKALDILSEVYMMARVSTAAAKAEAPDTSRKAGTAAPRSAVEDTIRGGNGKGGSRLKAKYIMYVEELHGRDKEIR